jgi:hypothetical protein
VKQVLLAQRRFVATARSRRRKPSQPQFMRRDYFAEAILLFRLVARATGRFAEELARWESPGGPTVR